MNVEASDLLYRVEFCLSSAYFAKLKDLLPTAASPSERREQLWLKPKERGCQADTIIAREQAWIEAVAENDQAAFWDLVADRGMDIKSFRNGLYDCEISDSRYLPDWALELLKMIASFGQGRDFASFRVQDLYRNNLSDLILAPDSQWLFQDAFRPLLRAAADELHDWMGTCPISISPEAESGMLAELARNWTTASTQVLASDLTIADIVISPPQREGTLISQVYLGDEVKDVTLEGWIDVWYAYPVLARVLAQSRLNWRSSITKFLTRYSADASDLDGTFSPSGYLGRLESYDSGAGDNHGGGESVTYLVFHDGSALYYKPKDLSIAVSFQNIVGRLNEAGDMKLETVKTLARDGYAWQEEIQRLECTGDEAVGRYYYRLGMLARLSQLLNTTDCHHENIIAKGELPVLVDIETILSPIPPFPGQVSSGEKIASWHLLDSPLTSSMLTCKVFGERGKRQIDLSVLSRRGRYQAPFKMAMIRSVSSQERRLVLDYGSIRTGNAVPRFGEHDINPAEYISQIMAGFEDMGRRIREYAAELGSENGVLQGTAKAVTRYVHRPTNLYFRLLFASLSATCMRDGITREIMLERLWKSRLKHGGPVAIVHSEIESLRNLDIPLFSSKPSSDALIAADSLTIPKYFEAPVLDVVLGRISCIGSQPIEKETALLAAALFMRDPATPPLPNRLGCLGPPVGTSTGSWLDSAIKISEEIIASALSTSRSDWVWVGMNYNPRTDSMQFGILRDDLFSGTLGLAIVLADVAVHGDRKEFGIAAQEILLTAKGRLSRYSSSEAGWFSAQRGLLTAAAHVGNLLNDQDLIVLAQTLSLGVSSNADRAVRSNPATQLTQAIADSNDLVEVDDATLLKRVASASPAPGSGLLIYAMKRLRNQPALLKELHSSIQRYISREAKSTWDRIEQAEVALSVFQLFGSAEHLACAREQAHAIKRDFQSRGKWLPDLMAPDRTLLSAVWGLGALAHLFLRLHHPAATPSIRLIEVS